MSVKVGIPILKLNNKSGIGKHKGNLKAVALEALSERCCSDSDLSKALSASNEYTGYTSGIELMQAITQESEEYSKIQQENGKRKLRDDAIIGYAMIVKPPAEWINTLSATDKARFFADSDDIVFDIMGKDNIRATALHRDERGEHKHYFGMPYTDDGRLCAKDAINLKLYSKFNKTYPTEMRKRGWDIADCTSYDAEAVDKMTEEDAAEYKTKHIADKKAKGSGKSSKVFKANKERIELDELIISEVARVTNLEYALDAREKLVQQREEDLKAKSKENLQELKERSDSLTELARIQNKKETEFQKKEDALEAQQRNLKAREERCGIVEKQIARKEQADALVAPIVPKINTSRYDINF